MSTLPPIMANAREDLHGHQPGDFSPADWDLILARAAAELRRSPKPEPQAWADVVRAFHRERQWGFKADYRPPKPPKVKPHEKNLGISFIYYVGRSFLFTKVIVLYSAARWTAGYGAGWGWVSLSAITFMIVSYARFIWRHGRGRED